MIILVRVFVCIFAVGLTLYFYVHEQNDLTELRLQIPVIEKELRKLQEENHRLEYQIDRFENPIHLMELARQPEYRHLKHPYLRDVIILPSGECEGESKGVGRLSVEFF